MSRCRCRKSCARWCSVREALRATEITDHVVQLTRVRFVNAYLVREEDGITLIDTTLQGAANDLLQAAERAGGAIRRIALTHGHGDHIGSLDALKAALPGEVEVLIPELDAQILDGERIGDGKPKGSWPKVTTKPDVRLRGGERVGSLEVVACPGHTPGHVAYLDTRDQTLIAGDVFTSFGRVAVSSAYYWRFPLATMGTNDKQQNLSSARSLRELDPAMLAVGHGPVTERPVAAMERAIAAAG